MNEAQVWMREEGVHITAGGSALRGVGDVGVLEAQESVAGRDVLAIAHSEVRDRKSLANNCGQAEPQASAIKENRRFFMQSPSS